MPHGRSARGLDWLSFFVANVQTGFGPFIAAYLAAEKWTQGQIGLALTIGTVTSMVMQVPGGAIVDAIRDKRGLALAAVGAIAAAALILGTVPERFPVGVAEVLHGFASCLLGPVIAALSVAVAGLQGHALGERLGRNARFASIGSGCAAGLMGAVGYWVSERSVFFLAAALVLPAVIALRWIRVAPTDLKEQRPPQKLSHALLDRRLIIFAICCAGFQFANAAMFPLAAVQVTRNTGRLGELVIAACLIVPQALVAALSPFAGRAAERWGRRPVLLLGFAGCAAAGVALRPHRSAGAGRRHPGPRWGERGRIRRAVAPCRRGYLASVGPLQPVDGGGRAGYHRCRGPQHGGRRRLRRPCRHVRCFRHARRRRRRHNGPRLVRHAGDPGLAAGLACDLQRILPSVRGMNAHA